MRHTSDPRRALERANPNIERENLLQQRRREKK